MTFSRQLHSKNIIDIWQGKKVSFWVVFGEKIGANLNNINSLSNCFNGNKCLWNFFAFSRFWLVDSNQRFYKAKAYSEPNRTSKMEFFV